jgi:ABC-type branched-subunit amino acid transport system substrate-binding protein
MRTLKSFALAFALCSIPLGLHAADTNTLKVGVQLPLTGERADVGKLMQNALQMALDKVNAAPGKGPKLELAWADDESTTDGIAKSLDKLVHDPQVIAIAGEINSPLVLASAPIVDKEGLPYITGGSSPRTTAASPWIFRAGASDALLTKFLTDYMVDDLKAKDIAILHDKTGVHNQRAGLVADALKAQGIVVSVNGTWSPGDRSFTAQLEQVKAAHAKVLLALGETAEGGAFFKDAKAAGLQAQIVAHRDFGTKSVLDEAGAAADGALIFTEYAPALMGQNTQTWAAAYKKRFGSDANVIAAQYYDSLLLIAGAMKTGGATRAGVRSGLEHLKAYPGVMADYTFDANRNGAHRFFVAKVGAGKLALVKVLSESSQQ